MKSFTKTMILITTFILYMTISNISAKEIKLEQPNLDDSFLKILNNRVSTRDYDNTRKIDNKTLSEILWSAFGITRLEETKRTIPTALNKQDLEIYVIKKDGTWLYDAKKLILKLITNKDLTSYFNTQDCMPDVDIILLYITKEENDYSLMHAGSAYQNVALYCAKNGIGNIVRGYFDKEGIAKELQIDNDNVIISQAIGYKK